MQIISNQLKHCDLLKVSGRIDSATAPHLNEALNKITEAGRFKIVLDMSDVDFISSAGMRVMVNFQKVCRRYNRGEIALAALPPTIFAALELAGFTAFFKIYDDAVIAVGNF